MMGRRRLQGLTMVGGMGNSSRASSMVGSSMEASTMVDNRVVVEAMVRATVRAMISSSSSRADTVVGRVATTAEGEVKSFRTFYLFGGDDDEF